MCKSDNANASVRIYSSPLQLIQCWLFICECECEREWEWEWEWERVKWPNRSLVFDLVYVRPFSLCMANCQTVFLFSLFWFEPQRCDCCSRGCLPPEPPSTSAGQSWPSFIQRNIQIPFDESIVLIPPLFLCIYGSFGSRVCGPEAMESKSKSKWNYCCKQEQLHHSQHHSAATQSPLYWWLIFSLRSPGSSLRQRMLCKQVDRQTHRQTDRQADRRTEGGPRDGRTDTDASCIDIWWADYQRTQRRTTRRFYVVAKEPTSVTRFPPMCCATFRMPQSPRLRNMRLVALLVFAIIDEL